MGNLVTKTNSESEWYKLQNAVKTWILSNANYQGDRMDRTTAENTATDFLNKVHVYDIRDDADSHREKIFKVYIGEPKFRGTTSYTLPAHALQFNSAQPTDIRILTTGNDMPEWWSTLQESFLNTGPNVLGNWGQTSIHPHVNPEGQPCLGGWSNAWSYAISSGDIPSLINVAKSFLNTWTRADSYWDINRHYNSWKGVFEDYHRDMGGFFPFKDCLQHGFLWQRLSRNIETSYRWNLGITWKWLANNYELIQQLCHENGDDYKWKIYDYYLATIINTRNVADTEAGKLDKVYSITNMIERILSAITEALATEIGCPYWVAKRLTGDAILYGVDNLNGGIVKNMHLIQDSDGNYPPSWDFNRGLAHLRDSLNSGARELQPSQTRVELIEMSAVYETMRRANRGNSILNRGYISEQDYYLVLLDYISYGPRWQTGNRTNAPNTFRLIESILTLAYNEKVWDANELINIGLEITGDNYSEDRVLMDDVAPLDNMFTHINGLIDDEEVKVRITSNFIYNGMERYTKICMKQLKGRMQDAKEHYRWEEEVVQPGNPRTNVA